MNSGSLHQSQFGNVADQRFDETQTATAPRVSAKPMILKMWKYDFLQKRNISAGNIISNRRPAYI